MAGKASLKKYIEAFRILITQIQIVVAVMLINSLTLLYKTDF